MTLRRLTPFVIAAVIAAACGEDTRTDPVVGPGDESAAAHDVSGELSEQAEEIAETIEALFPAPGLRNAALTQLANIDRQKSRGELEDARMKTLDLVAFVADHEEAGNLLDPPGPTTTEEAAAGLINDLLAFGGIAVPDLSEGALSEDGAVALVQPDEETTVTNEVEEAGVMLPAGTFDEPTLVVIDPIEETGSPGDGAGPLPTSLDQYPLFFDISASSEPTGEFVVGLCVVDPPDPFAPSPQVADRLRLAHPDPQNPQAVEILELATATFLDCSDASTVARSRMERALGELGALAVRLTGIEPLEANPGGLGGLARSFSPFGAVDTLGGFVDVATGDRHSCAVTADGGLFCWGSNADGQLGDGRTSSPSSVPVAVASSDTFTAVEAGGSHTCALTVDGDALCWGANGFGQLGDGTTTGSSSPVAVSGGLSFTSLSAGLRHTCGIDPSSLAYCWGVDNNEQVGAPTTETCTFGTSSLACSTSPLLAFQGLQSVSAGIFGTCGVTTADEAVCWGQNVGQFGDGTTDTEPSAVAAYGGITLDVLEVGSGYSCAVEPGGDASCSGFNASGQLGDGTTTSTLGPVAVSGVLDFASLEVNAANSIFTHTCGVTTGGEAYCWGANDAGQLGAASSETCTSGSLSLTCSTTPVAVSGGLNFAQVDPGGLAAFMPPGGGHTCGVTTDGELYCWGANEVGQLGDGTTTDRATPTQVTIPPPPMIE